VRRSLRDFTGATVIRFESADGCSYNVDDEEAQRRIGFGDTKFRAMPGSVVGREDVHAYLYRVLGLDPHRYAFDLPSTVYGTGASRTGHGGGSGSREGFVFERGKPDHPVGKLFFLTHDRRFREGDPECRADFEELR
jgi:hypothetical protein